MRLSTVQTALADDTRVKDGLQAFSAGVVEESCNRTHTRVGCLERSLRQSGAEADGKEEIHNYCREKHYFKNLADLFVFLLKSRGTAIQ